MIVGLSGYARSGKDSAAQALVEVGFRRIAFADRLKDLANLIWPEHMVRYGDWDQAKQNPEVREHLQLLGESVRDVLGEDTWVRAALDGINPGGDFVISDVRYANEAEYVSRLGGLVVRINRPGVQPANGHLSEVGLDDWRFDAVIQNDGTLDDLKDRMRTLGRCWSTAIGK